MDIDKDLIRPTPPARRKRPSALKCVVVVCCLIGLLTFGTIVYFVGSFVRDIVIDVRNPHQSLYLNATSNETAIHPVIGKEDTFDVYLTIWARVPDAEAGITDEMEESAREKFDHLVSVKSMTNMPQREILFDPTERVVFSQRMFEGVSRKSKNLHKDISFELPLVRFYDKLVFEGDVRAAVVIIPNSPIWSGVKEWSGWKPNGALSLPRLDDETASQLGLSGIKRDALDALSYSFHLIELHDRNYDNRTRSKEELASLEAAVDDDNSAAVVPDKNKRVRWESYQPHFLTKSHVALVDQSRPLHKTAWEKRHNETRNGSRIGMGISRFLCNRSYKEHGDWEHRLVIDTDQGEEVKYGAYLQTINGMAGPKHLFPLPVDRGLEFEENYDEQTVTVHHQFTFSSFSPGRYHVLENMVNPHAAPKNATEGQLIQAHSDWEQFHGILGSRGKDTHPRTRFILGLLDDIFLSWPILLLSILYWYTRTTSTGLDSIATIVGASALALDLTASMYKGARSKTVSWPLFLFVGFLSIFDFAQGYFMLQLVLPFEVVWKGWLPRGLVRSRWTKRERATRRLEGKVNWTQRGIFAVATYALVFTVSHYNLWFIRPLIKLPKEYDDTDLPTFLTALIGAAGFVTTIFQAILNYHSKSFAGSYAISAYMVFIRTLLKLTRFWPWFIGRYEVRGGLGVYRVIEIILEIVYVFQAWTYPRVEQVVAEDDE